MCHMRRIDERVASQRLTPANAKGTYTHAHTYTHTYTHTHTHTSWSIPRTCTNTHTHTQRCIAERETERDTFVYHRVHHTCADTLYDDVTLCMMM